MARYAKGKHAVLISDRSGWKIKYKDARTEWTGARVSKEEWEAKQPQLDPQKYLKRSAGGNVLYDPRPDNDSVPTTVRLGPLHSKYSGQAAINQGIINISTFEDASGFELTTSLYASPFRKKSGVKTSIVVCLFIFLVSNITFEK